MDTHAFASTPTIATRLKELDIEVEGYRTVKTGVVKSSYAFKQSSLYYSAVPIAILVMLLYIRPGFILVTSMDTTTKKEVNSIGYKKLFVSWLIISTLFAVGIFGYNYKKKNV